MRQPKLKSIKLPIIAGEDKYDKRIKHNKFYLVWLTGVGWYVTQFYKTWYGFSFAHGWSIGQVTDKKCSNHPKILACYEIK